jgi:hypothetical protein
MNQRADPTFVSLRLEAALTLRETLRAELNATALRSSQATTRALAIANDRRAVIESLAAIERSRAALSRPANGRSTPCRSEQS